MKRLKFDAWALVHAIAVRVERAAVRIRHYATAKSTRLNIAILNDERRRT